MRTPTTAEIREKNIHKLAERSDNFTTDPITAISNARKAMNSFYRLAGYSERLFYINNDYDLYSRYTKNGRLDRMESREENWIKRVNIYLSEFHARAVYNGVYPSICDEPHTDDHGCIRDLYLTAWY